MQEWKILKIYHFLIILLHFTITYAKGPDSSDSKASAYNAGDPGSIPGSERSPGEGNGNPPQYSCLEKSHGPRSLVGYSPCGRKGLDTTKRLHFHFHAKGQVAFPIKGQMWNILGFGDHNQSLSCIIIKRKKTLKV